MTRVVVTKTTVIPALGSTPAVTIPAGSVAELTSAQVTAVTTAGGAVRATTSASAHDQLGEAFGVSNSD